MGRNGLSNVFNTHLFDAPDVLLVSLSLPCINGQTCLGNGCGGVVLGGEDVAARPLDLWTQRVACSENEFMNGKN